MQQIREVNFSFFYMLVFTIVSSILAYTIIAQGYDVVFANSYGIY